MLLSTSLLGSYTQSIDHEYLRVAVEAYFENSAEFWDLSSLHNTNNKDLTINKWWATQEHCVFVSFGVPSFSIVNVSSLVRWLSILTWNNDPNQCRGRWICCLLWRTMNVVAIRCNNIRWYWLIDALVPVLIASLLSVFGPSTPQIWILPLRRQAGRWDYRGWHRPTQPWLPNDSPPPHS